VWFKTDQCMQVKTKEKQFIYVFDDFVGDAFRNIVATGNRSVCDLQFILFLHHACCI